MTIRALDELTGLPSRTVWRQALEEALAAGRSIGLIVMDLDRFMLLNDQHGHDRGDDALRDIAARLDCNGALACRYGGDEFMFLVLEGVVMVAAWLGVMTAGDVAFIGFPGLSDFVALVQV